MERNSSTKSAITTGCRTGTGDDTANHKNERPTHLASCQRRETQCKISLPQTSTVPCRASDQQRNHQRSHRTLACDLEVDCSTKSEEFRLEASYQRSDCQNELSSPRYERRRELLCLRCSGDQRPETIWCEAVHGQSLFGRTCWGQDEQQQMARIRMYGSRSAALADLRTGKTLDTGGTPA